MFEKDYVMRLIHEMARAIAKLFFGLDTPTQAGQLFEDDVVRKEAERLIRLADEGQIGLAEDRLFGLMEGGGEEALKAALLFYAHLNDMTDEFLEAHDFSREEVRTGLEDTAELYGLEPLSDIFFPGESAQ